VLITLSTTAPLHAQPAEPVAEDDIDAVVANALYERATMLYGRGDVANAKQLFIEAIERRPEGDRAADARSMVRTCNERLGLEPDDGMPGVARSAPLDPYRGPEGGSPDGRAPSAGDESRERGAEDRQAHIGLSIWSGSYGLLTGLAVGGPMAKDADGNDELSGTAVVTGLVGGAALAGLGYWLGDRYPLSAGQSAAIASAGTWGTVTFGLLGDVVTGRQSDTNDVFKLMAVGGAFGIGGGIAYAWKMDPSVGDVAFANSLTSYGIGAGLLVGVLISPPRREAYSLNALFGAVAGATAGVLLTDHVEISRKRTLWLDLGAAAGVASTWIVVYPFLADGGTNDDEQALGLLSTLGMGAGVAVAWLLTRDLDADASTGSALWSRDPAGRWSWAVPRLEPIATGDGLGIAVRLLAGDL